MKIKVRYCLPIIKKSQPDVLDMIEKNSANYGFFEIWLDYIEAVDQEFIDDLVEKFTGKLVFTLRRKDTVKPLMDNHKMKAIISGLSGKKCLLDLDVTQVNQLDVVIEHKMQNQLILSFHDYAQTPEDIYLDKIVAKMQAFRPYILKLSTLCKQPSDALRLLKYKRDFLESGEKHIVSGMGEDGKITRVFGAVWGNELIYIPEDESEASAAGQITRSEMNKIVERMT